MSEHWWDVISEGVEDPLTVQDPTDWTDVQCKSCDSSMTLFGVLPHRCPECGSECKCGDS